ncbi:lipid IV(A) 3-deoxy-D-manno-octulosonic acid transferase [Campylobacter sp. 2018MI35]|uniref:lipid IV(A) 3-deoxy-D-manno-octulosonic acid transferase n=1 Tax=Campylobacter sp. 2018MI34 TaxID=2800582 RepID=UPI0019064E3D|nr:lipid IV(A) 3-deoxy-D-manno-octulosonic acid transferase [Campylobacter sp. 2018MI34]MBK1992334.1 lipid IV(A) 3-deoxy-D-manno-octulosonic acid transferase [Campylobacter sp. 2018MI34]
MIVFYYLLIWIAYILLAIPLFFLSFLKAKYKYSLKARFFLYKNLIQEKKDVHFHACSLGEVKSIKDLTLLFDSRITTITQTGYEEAKKFCKSVNYLVFENWIPFWLKPCKVLVIFEAEYWLILILISKLKGAKIILINARISDKSYKNYKRFAFFYKKIFSYIDEVFAQSKEDKKKLIDLGARNVKITGNIKINSKIQVNKNYEKLDQKLIIFANTHKGEEYLLLEHFTLKKGEKLIIAPRHPERFEEVANLLRNKKLDFVKFSSLNLSSSLKDEFKSPILLLDSIGELVNFYAISDIVVLGGSFIKGIGGHNPIEAAFFDNILISGIYFYNQKKLYEAVENIYLCNDINELDDKIRKLQKKTKIIHKNNLNLIIESIKKGINARKSL